MIVLDTSTLLFWTLDPRQLSPTARQAIEGSGQCVVSSISIWEIALKVKRGKLILPLAMADYVERLQRLERLEIQPVDIQTWLDNVNLEWEHCDPADRTIVATATQLDCPLVSSDNQISNFYSKTIW